MIDHLKHVFIGMRLSASPLGQIFEYSRTNHGFDSTNLWTHMVWQIHDSSSNIRIFRFDRVKMPFTVWTCENDGFAWIYKQTTTSSSFLLSSSSWFHFRTLGPPNTLQLRWCSLILGYSSHFYDHSSAQNQFYLQFCNERLLRFMHCANCPKKAQWLVEIPIPKLL